MRLATSVNEASGACNMDIKEYHSGFYCKQNFLKFLIADVGLFMPKQIFTSVDVEARTGIHRKKVGNALWHYKKVGIPYFRRLPKKDPNGLISRTYAVE